MSDTIRVMNLHQPLYPLAGIIHEFSTAANAIIRRAVRTATRKAGTPALLNVLQGVRLRWPLVARGATHSGRRFRRFVTRTYE